MAGVADVIESIRNEASGCGVVIASVAIAMATWYNFLRDLLEPRLAVDELQAGAG